jgi:hypothetical protein
MSTSKSTASAPSRAVDRDDDCGRQEDGGTAIVGTIAGVTVFLLMMLLAVQVTVRMYATSTLTAVAFDAAHEVASAAPADRIAVEQDATAGALASLGGFGRANTTFKWMEADDRQVVLEVVGRSAAFLPLPAGVTRIERTVTVKTEQFR